MKSKMTSKNKTKNTKFKKKSKSDDHLEKIAEIKKVKSVSEMDKSEDESESDGETQPGSVHGVPNVREVSGFPGVEEDDDDEYKTTRSLVQAQNRKQKKSGGFQAMGLSHNVHKGVTRKGYQIPTPIQRKTVPLIMDGKDVVAMARTGSGKTAAFLIPMFERLKTHSSSGARALILAPTRELALQTLAFTKDLGRFTGLKAAVVLGGDSMEEQFAALHENPDVIIATPGRFMHVLVEMDAKLSSMEYLVFDEADRLFEMGFQEQLEEILKRMPESRQTLLFSATLPKLLVEFARAGLHDPTLVRLDLDSKLSEQLKMCFIQCRSEEKISLVLYLLRQVIKPSQQTVMFVATKHHVEYMHMILDEAGISSSYSYSSLDHTARKINVAKFRSRKTQVLIVTDLAARGIDIPLLDNVININFPAKSKLFVHRVGRVARAGMSGTAYSLVSPDEIPYVLDLHLFLGRPINLATPSATEDEDGTYGRVPQSVIDMEEGHLRSWMEKTDLAGMKKVIINAQNLYKKSRPAPSQESIRRMKEEDWQNIGFHPLFGSHDAAQEDAIMALLDSVKNYKPNITIFEVNSTKKTNAFEVMKKKRSYHTKVIESNDFRKETKKEKRNIQNAETRTDQEKSTEDDIQSTFHHVVGAKRVLKDPSYFDEKKKKKRKVERKKDAENYVSYRPKDFQSERGLSLGTSFEKEAALAVVDFGGDDRATMNKNKNSMKWDRKKKKFVSAQGGKDNSKKKVKTESGQWINASYKSNIYKEWLGRSKRQDTVTEEGSDNEGVSKPGQRKRPGLEVMGGGYRRGFHRGTSSDQTKKQGELKRKEEILKARKIKAKKEAFMQHRTNARKKRKAVQGKKKKVPTATLR